MGKETEIACGVCGGTASPKVILIVLDDGRKKEKMSADLICQSAEGESLHRHNLGFPPLYTKNFLFTLAISALKVNAL